MKTVKNNHHESEIYPLEKGLVSVIIPVYNGEEHIEKLIKSITNQTYKNIEIITVDNDSTDNSIKFAVLGTKLDSVDSDGDGFSDREELERNTNPTNKTSIPFAVQGDQDGDGLSDIFEDAIGTSVTNIDSDSDGFNDQMEVLMRCLVSCENLVLRVQENS